MARSAKWRRRLKWAGTLACVAMAFPIVSPYGFSWNSRSGQCQLLLGAGGAGIAWRPGSTSLNCPAGFQYRKTGVHLTLWYYSHGDYVADYPQFGSGQCHWCVLPLWKPFLLVAALTILLWWHDRHRIPAGHCQHCGYDLTGNTSGVCPECGRSLKNGAGGDTATPAGQ